MECRDARPLIARLNTLAETERVGLGQHLHGCVACRDEIADPFIIPSGLPMATPPPGLEARILSRLPAVSPIALAQRRQRTLGLVRGALISTLSVATVASLAGLAGLQFSTVRTADLVQGVAIPLALASKALLIALAQSWPTFLLLLAAIAVPFVLRRLRLPVAATWSRRSTLAGIAVVVMLLALNVAGSRGDLGTLTTSLDIDRPVAGDVTSLGGDIIVRDDIMGDVVALAGRVVLEEGSHVYGSVLAGSGAVTSPAGIVDQHVYMTPPGILALASVSGSNTGVALMPGTVARLGGLLAALATLLLGALLVVIRPELAAWGSRQLTRFPGRALLLGILTSSGLVILALGGSVILAATVAGVLLVPLLLLLLHLPFAAGVATIGYMLGYRLTGSRASTSAIWGIGLQLVLLLALGLTMPLIGLLIFYLLGTAGLGGTLLGRQNSPLRIG